VSKVSRHVNVTSGNDFLTMTSGRMTSGRIWMWIVNALLSSMRMHISGCRHSCRMFNCRFWHLTVQGRRCRNFELSCMFISFLQR
jgi:hypothetical protein